MITPRRPRLALAVLLAFAVTLACFVAVPGPRAAVRTALLLPSLFTDSPIMPLVWLEPEPVTETVPLDAPHGEAYGLIVRPRGDGPYPAVVFSAGMAKEPAEDPRLRALTGALARDGLAVMLVVSEPLADRRLRPEEIGVITHAFQVLRGQPYVDPSRVGLVGVSVGGSLALLAAAEPEVREDVRFVSAMGPYYSLPDVIRATTTEAVCLDGACEPWEPDPLTKHVVRTHLLDTLDPEMEDRVERLLDDPRPDPAAVEALPPPARAVYLLLAQPDPRRFDERLAQLPEEDLQDLAVLSPEDHMGQIRARVFLLHARGDPLIPHVESRRISREARENGLRIYYAEIAILEHLDITAVADPGVLLRDAVRLAVYVHWAVHAAKDG